MSKTVPVVTPCCLLPSPGLYLGIGRGSSLNLVHTLLTGGHPPYKEGPAALQGGASNDHPQTGC
jgi:hypothetical protein